jgi:hypothetical protein
MSDAGADGVAFFAAFGDLRLAGLVREGFFTPYSLYMVEFTSPPQQFRL